MTNTNAHFDNAIALQSDIAARTKTAKDSKTKLDQAAFVQMVMFITGNVDGNRDKTGNRLPTIKGKTKAAAAWKEDLIEQHKFPKRHAQTIASIALNKNLVRIVIKGLVKLGAPYGYETTEVELLQMVTDILAENELTTVNKLKQFIADPVDRVAKLLEAIAKLDTDERESFDIGYLELGGGDAE
jgi:hypothetical protein